MIMLIIMPPIVMLGLAVIAHAVLIQDLRDRVRNLEDKENDDA
jgi:hypothetical protein